MTFYTGFDGRARPVADVPARPRDATSLGNSGDESSESPPAIIADPRVLAFAELVEAADRGEWRAGLLASRRLRSMGYSVCLTRPTSGSGVVS